MAPRESFAPYTQIWDYAFHFFLYARQVDRNPFFQADLASMLVHLQAALTPAFEKYRGVLSQWYEDEHSVYYLKGKDGLEPDLVIMSACVCFGILNFVAEKFAKEPQLCSRVTNHVSSIFCFLMDSLLEEYPGDPHEYSHTSMLELLLAHGTDPNSGLDGPSEWRKMLEELAGTDDAERLKCFEAIKLLLRHGADFEQQCTYDPELGGEKVEVKANALLREWFNADQFGVLEDIVKRRASKTKKSQKISKKMRHLKLWINSKK